MAVPLPPTNPRFPPYGGGNGGGGGSGGSGGGSSGGGSTMAGSVSVPVSNGGVFAQSRVALYPVQSLVSGNMDYFSFNPLVAPNDMNNGSSYSWRVEELEPYRSYTVRGIIWTFTDLGQVSVTWQLTGVNENQEVVTATNSLGVGNAVPTGAMMSVLVSVTQTAMNQQLSVTRIAGAGPLSVVKVTMYGDIEENTLP